MHYPSPKNEFLLDFVESIKKRNKTLKYRASSIKCDRVLVREEGVETEKIELILELSHSNGYLPFSIYAWEDRWIWVDIRLMEHRRWVWSWAFEGRLLGNLGGKTVINAIERTIEASFEMSSVNTTKFDEIWSVMLARGPESFAQKKNGC